MVFYKWNNTLKIHHHQEWDKCCLTFKGDRRFQTLEKAEKLLLHEMPLIPYIVI
jgi:hypothetical protein